MSAKKRSKYARVWGLIHALRIPHADPEAIKCDLVRSLSNGRTTHLPDLTPEELMQLETGLRSMLERSTPREEVRARKRHRSAVLRLIEQYGIDTHDWERVNAFTRDPRIAGKDFGRLTPDELDTLRRKLHSILRRKRAKEIKENVRIN